VASQVAGHRPASSLSSNLKKENTGSRAKAVDLTNEKSPAPAGNASPGQQKSTSMKSYINLDRDRNEDVANIESIAERWARRIIRSVERQIAGDREDHDA
jgi:hypothetical protein